MRMFLVRTQSHGDDAYVMLDQKHLTALIGLVLKGAGLAKRFVRNFP